MPLSSKARRTHSSTSRLVRPASCTGQHVTRGRSLASRGKSHSCETPTIRFISPSAAAISVAAGSSETMRFTHKHTRYMVRGNRGRALQLASADYKRIGLCCWNDARCRWKSFVLSGEIPFTASACDTYCTAELKSPVSAYAAARVSIMCSSFHTVMLHAAFASFTACCPLRNDAFGLVARNQARSLSTLASVTFRG